MLGVAQAQRRELNVLEAFDPTTRGARAGCGVGCGVRGARCAVRDALALALARAFPCV